jgi:hypothetical protein
VADVGVEEVIRVSGGGDAAGDEEFGNDRRDACGAGQECGFFGGAEVENPALSGTWT